MIRLQTCCLSSTTSQWGRRAVEEFGGEGGGLELGGYISSHEQIILNLLSSVTYCILKLTTV
jgi:hypothetical protein